MINESYVHPKVHLAYSQGTTSVPLNLRLRRTIDPAIASTGEVPWQLRYIGQPEIGNNRPTIVRSCYDIACSENAVEFLAELGCRLEFEYIAKGKKLCTCLSLMDWF